MSYVLSRTLVPTMVHYCSGARPPDQPVLAAFERGFGRLRTGYGRGLAWAAARAFVSRASRSSSVARSRWSR